MTNVAIIPARGGSKRIPRKNIKYFRGKPIIAYSIETAIETGLFENIIISTDDEEIAATAIRYGAEVPFYRSKSTADDFASTSDVICEVLIELKKFERNYEYACCIYPTAPLISKENIVNAYDLLTSKKFTSVFPVCKFSYPIYRGLQMKENDKVEMIWPENLNRRSQDLQPAYHDAGQFYWIDAGAFLNEKKIFSENSGGIVLDEMSVQDIDNEADWKLAEIKHSILFPDAAK